MEDRCVSNWLTRRVREGRRSLVRVGGFLDRASPTLTGGVDGARQAARGREWAREQSKVMQSPTLLYSITDDDEEMMMMSVRHSGGLQDMSRVQSQGED